MQGKAGSLDKEPWKSVPAPHGPVEAEFLRPVVLGETIVPFRLLETSLAVIPLDGKALLNSEMAIAAGYRHLGVWLRDIETKWAAHCNRDRDGNPRMTLSERIDHMRTLSVQVGSTGPRVVYTASGKILSAAIVEDCKMIVEHKAYWSAVRCVDEARYLCAILNSAAALKQVTPQQSRGEFNPRDLDKLVWGLSIPLYDANDPLHRDLASAAEKAGMIAASAGFTEGAHFVTKRRAIRAALAADGIAEEIEVLVTALLAA